MAKIWENRPGYKLARHYVDFISRTGFSSYKVYGRENLPKEGSVLYAPNHCAALLDPLMILNMDGTKRPVVFGARADLFKNKFIGSIMTWLHIVPLARERDGLKEVAKNYAVFDEITDCLDHEVPFCMYVEGTHRADRGMLPVRKGIFKLCRIANEKIKENFYIVPIGINYEYFFKQMGDVEIHIGKPIDVSKVFAEQGDIPDREFYLAQRKKLQEEISSLIDRFPKKKDNGNIVLRTIAAFASLPIFAGCAAASLPIWGIAELIMCCFKDKAWTHTVYFACRALLPWFLPFYWIFALLLKFYGKIINDIKK